MPKLKLYRRGTVQGNAAMKARQLISGGAYGPDQLKVLYKGFDKAWDAVAPGVSARAGAVEAARMKLANIVLGLAKGDSRDAEAIKDAAIQIFRADGRK